MPDAPIIGEAIAPPAAARDALDLRGLARLAGWGAGAVTALLVAVMATHSEPGAKRMAAAFGGGTSQAGESIPVAARSAEIEFERQQLSATVRSLAADRDRLLTRVTVLERNLEDVTGSIPRTPAKPAAPAEPPRKVADPEPAASADAAQLTPITIGPSLVATISSPLTIPSPSPETLAQVGLSAIPTVEDGVSARTDFGIDIGSGPTLAALRATWSSLRRTHRDLFEGLHPVIAVRDANRQGAVELRLILGPLGNAAAAARLCGKVANAGISCQPAIFDGQRLALR
jgi:hypothetical protein